MCSDLGSGSRCCAFYSATGLIFTPFLISGIEDVEKAATSAFGASGMFLFTFLASLGGIWYDGSTKAEPINQGESEAEYHLSKETPSNYGTTA